MDFDSKRLRKTLKASGLSDRAINAAWPEWWSSEADGSPSARAELCFAVARKLGIAPKSLFEERVEFVWRDRARFKHVTAETQADKSALSSFGVSLGRQLLAMAEGAPRQPATAVALRRAILSGNNFVDLNSLISTCWALGVPVVHLRVFPLRTKSMHAMIVQADGRFAILLGKDSNYPAPIAFTLAHELGHLMLGHLKESAAIVDFDDPDRSLDDRDAEEIAADEYALAVLTGTSAPTIQADGSAATARSLAQAVLAAGPVARIEPGTLALCFAYQAQEWATGMGSLRYIYSEAKPVWKEVNSIAEAQLDWSQTTDDNADYIRAVLGLGDA